MVTRLLLHLWHHIHRASGTRGNAKTKGLCQQSPLIFREKPWLPQSPILWSELSASATPTAATVTKGMFSVKGLLWTHRDREIHIGWPTGRVWPNKHTLSPSLLPSDYFVSGTGLGTENGKIRITTTFYCASNMGKTLYSTLYLPEIVYYLLLLTYFIFLMKKK